MLRILLPVASTVTALATWEVLSVSGVLPPEIPPVSAIATWLGTALGTAELWTAVARTLGHWAAALAVGVLVGALVGAAMAALPVVNELLLGTVEFFRPIPVVVYLPIMLLLFGARSGVVIALAAVGALWPMLLQTFYGVQGVDPVARDTARVFGLTRTERLLRVTAPGVLPFVCTGIRIASTITLLIAVAMELIGAVPGVGNMLGGYAANGLYAATYGSIVVAGVLGMVLNAVFELLERRVLRWHPSHRIATT